MINPNILNQILFKIHKLNEFNLWNYVIKIHMYLSSQ
jgi:hypothetical protein